MTADSLTRNIEILELARKVRELLDADKTGLTAEEEETLKSLIFDDSTEIA